MYKLISYKSAHIMMVAVVLVTQAIILSTWYQWYTLGSSLQ
jgi:hypothetical protein